jgi:hypothetical protein
MISAIISLFGVVRGLFVAGGFFASIFTWISGSFGLIATALLWFGNVLKDFLVGTGVAIKTVAVYLAAYHLVELARRFLFITFIVSIFGFVINYAVNNVVIYGGQTITLLFNEFITSLISFGPLGQNLLAFLSKMGFFDALSLLLTVMLYTLISRVALNILFK